MKASGQPYTRATLRTVEEPPIPMEWGSGGGWVPEPVATFQISKKSLATVQFRTRNLFTIGIQNVPIRSLRFCICQWP